MGLLPVHRLKRPGGRDLSRRRASVRQGLPFKSALFP